MSEFRRRILSAVSRGERQQDLEEHDVVRSGRPPGLRPRTGHAVRLRRHGVRQELRMSGVKHGYVEDGKVSLLTERRRCRAREGSAPGAASPGAASAQTVKRLSPICRLTLRV